MNAPRAGGPGLWSRAHGKRARGKRRVRFAAAGERKPLEVLASVSVAPALQGRDPRRHRSRRERRARAIAHGMTISRNQGTAMTPPLMTALSR